MDASTTLEKGELDSFKGKRYYDSNGITIIIGS